MPHTSFDAPRSRTRAARQALRSALAAAVVVLAVVVVGCRDSTGPQDRPLAYSLHDVAGQPLPIVISTADSGEVTLVAESISPNADRSATQRWTLQFQGAPGEYGRPAPVYMVESRTLRYHRTMAWLALRVPRICEGTELCAPPAAEGPIVGAELTLRGLQPPGLGDHPRHFVRMSDFNIAD